MKHAGVPSFFGSEFQLQSSQKNGLDPDPHVWTKATVLGMLKVQADTFVDDTDPASPHTCYTTIIPKSLVSKALMIQILHHFIPAVLSVYYNNSLGFGI